VLATGLGWETSLFSWRGVNVPNFVNARVFSGVTSSTAYAGRVVEGRSHLVGFVLSPRYEAISTINPLLSIFGSLDLYNINESYDGKEGSSNSDAIVRIPVQASRFYTTVINISFSDQDGGVLFDRGIYVDETNVIGIDPLVAFDVNLFYVGGKVYDNSA